MIIKIDKSNKPFDMTKSHEFEPSGELARATPAQESLQTITKKRFKIILMIPAKLR